MPFTFKLSQRLARMRAVGLVVPAAVLAGYRLVSVAAPRLQVVRVVSLLQHAQTLHRVYL